MAYIPYPQAPTGPNGYQVLGQALGQIGTLAQDTEDRDFKMRQAMEEMTQKRKNAILAAQESELRQKQLEQDTRLKAEADQRAHDFALEAAKGKVMSPTLAKNPSLARRGTAPAAAPGRPSPAEMADLENVDGLNLPNQRVNAGPDATAMMGQALDNQPTDADTGRSPYTRDELIQLGLEKRQLDAKEYGTLTKPEKTVRDRFQVQEIGGRKVKVNLDTGDQEDLGPATKKPDRVVINEIEGRKVKVNLDTGDMVDLGPVTQKPVSQKDLATAKSKVTMLTLAKQQLDQVQKKFDDIKDSFSAGPAGQGKAPTPSGRAFDAAVDAIRGTMSGLTRVPGVGGMSDFETRLAQAPIPSRDNYEDVTQQSIDQWYQLINTLAEGYQGMLPGIEDAPPDEKAAKPKAGGSSLPGRGRFKPLDSATSGEYLKRAGWDGVSKSTPEQRKKAKAMLAKDGYNVGG